MTSFLKRGFLMEVGGKHPVLSRKSLETATGSVGAHALELLGIASIRFGKLTCVSMSLPDTSCSADSTWLVDAYYASLNWDERSYDSLLVCLLRIMFRPCYYRYCLKPLILYKGTESASALCLFA